MPVAQMTRSVSAALRARELGGDPWTPSRRRRYVQLLDGVRAAHSRSTIDAITTTGRRT